MKIAVNTRLLLKEKLGGIGWFTYQTLKRIVKDHPEHQFYFIFDRQWDEEFIFSDNVTPLKIGPQARHPFLWYIWFNISIPFCLRKIKADLFLSPDGFIPLHTKTRNLAVIHDINFHHLPGSLPGLVMKYHLKYFPIFARKANRIATVSEFSKQDIVESYEVEKEKIDVVYNGSDSDFRPLQEKEKKEIRDKWTEGKEYFVFIGSLLPRKNLCRSLKAFDKYKKESGSGIKLLVIGSPMFRKCRVFEEHKNMEFGNDVIFTSWMQREDITKVLASSRALLFASYYEGFGIPMLEAFRCEVPVLAGNLTALPEIGGEAAFYVDPYSPNDIARGMKEVDSNEKLRKNLIEEGRKRKDVFTWEGSAKNLWDSVERTIKQGS